MTFTKAETKRLNHTLSALLEIMAKDQEYTNDDADEFLALAKLLTVINEPHSSLLLEVKRRVLEDKVRQQTYKVQVEKNVAEAKRISEAIAAAAARKLKPKEPKKL